MKLLDPALIPSRLVDPSERTPVLLSEPAKPSRFRSLGALAAFMRLGLALLGLWLFRRLKRGEYARRLRELLEELGGLWIKAGQLLALRIDIFPSELCEELSKLQSRAYGFPGSMARQIIEDELGASLGQYFSEFDEVPFAAASIGQVHRARLREEGTWVAIKVQKPYSAELFQRDLAGIQRVVGLLRLFGILPFMRWDEGLEELRGIMREELDFNYEAASMRRMRRSLRRHKIYVGKVFASYSGPLVLVMEFIHGVLMSDYIKIGQTDRRRLQLWHIENDVDPERLARRLISSLFRQIFEDNLFHGDMHPGNIVLLRGNRISLVDFGTTNFTEREYLQKFRLFVRALATRDYAKAADLCFMLCGVLPLIDLEDVKEQLIKALRAWATRTLVKELPYHTKSIGNASLVIQSILVEFKCTMDWAWLRIHRAMATLDASLIHLYPDINYTRIVNQYFFKADVREIAGMRGERLALRAMQSMGTALQIQDRVNEYTMFQGSLIRRHVQVFKGATNKFADVLAGMVGLFALVALAHGVVFAGVFLAQHYPDTVGSVLSPLFRQFAGSMPLFDPQLSILIVSTDVYLIYVLRRLKNKLQQKDVRPHERVAAA